MIRFIATWFYIGLLKPAPGTWGSLGALPFIYIFLIIELNVLYLLIISSIVFILGCFATLIETKEKSEHDPSEIVIDEVVGQWITFTPLFIITSNEKFHSSISRNAFNVNINSET